MRDTLSVSNPSVSPRTKWEFWECSQCKVCGPFVLVLQIGRGAYALLSPQTPLNPDARLAQIYPTKDFTSSLCRRVSWSSGTQQSPIARRIFGQWMRADVYLLGSAYVPFRALLVFLRSSNFECLIFIYISSGKVYHIYTDPGGPAEESAEPVSTSPDTFKYDPDSMFEQYQVSANVGGMFRRFPFQRAFHGTCIAHL